MQAQLWLTSYGVAAYGKGRDVTPDHLSITSPALAMEEQGWLRLETVEVSLDCLSRREAAAVGLKNLEEQEAALRQRFAEAMQALNASRQEFLAIPFEGN